MRRRLVVPPGRLVAGPLALDPDHSRYLFRVLRLDAGAELELRDGAGRRAVGRLVARDRVDVGEVEQLPPDPGPRVHLVFAPPKGRRLDVLLEKATELGATTLTPMHTARSVRKDVSGERMARIVAEAARQCAAVWAPQLRPVVDFGAVFTAPEPGRMLVASPDADTPLRDVPSSTGDVSILTGPEGGFTAAEVDRARAHGAEAFHLGDRILRAETAPLAALTILRHSW